MKLFEELKRRNVIKATIAYVTIAWVLYEVGAEFLPGFGAPEWFVKSYTFILIAGLPVWVIFSWVYDITPEGIKKTSKMDQDRSVTVQTNKRLNIIIILTLSFLAVIIYFKNPTGPDKMGAGHGLKTLQKKSIAILPFENLSQEDGNEFFVDGLVDDLLNRISVIEELRVISRTSSEMYRERGSKRIPQIANELNVAFILEGSVQRYDNKVRIAVQLIDAKQDYPIWAESYDRNLSDVFETQREIALQIAFELDAILNNEQTALIGEEKTGNIRAFELYQLGRFYWNKRTGEGYSRSIEYFEKAIRLDTVYGLAYAGLADTYALMSIQGHMDKIKGAAKAKELAFKALGFDRNLPEAYTVLAEIYDYVEWEWEKAEAAYRRALELNPNYSTAQFYYAEHLSIIGMHDLARTHMDKALELDPLSFIIRYVSAKLYYHRGSFEKALRELKICNEIQPGHLWVHELRFMCYWQLNQSNSAYKELRSVISINSELYSDSPDEDIKTVDRIYKEKGINGVLRWKIDSDISQEFPPYEVVANSLALLGSDKEALIWLDKGFQQNQISPEMGFNINFKMLNDQKIFRDILKEMGLTKFL